MKTNEVFSEYGRPIRFLREKSVLAFADEEPVILSLSMGTAD